MFLNFNQTNIFVELNYFFFSVIMR